MSNENLWKARIKKDDEYYTSYVDVMAEVEHYKDQLYGKIVYCPCDDYRWSSFYQFFKDKFQEYGLSEVRATNYDLGEGAFYARYGTFGEVVVQLQGDGDFRSPEAVKIKDESDVVITNPPFSLMRDFVIWLSEGDGIKDCLFIGGKTMFVCKDVFPLVKSKKLRVGYKYGTIKFGEKSVASGWFTTMKVEPRKLELKSKYNEGDYPVYDNMDAVEVSKVKDIPEDYLGLMGVPLTYLPYDNEEFEIYSVACGNSWANYKSELKQINFNPDIKYGGGLGVPVLNGKGLYPRLLIKRKLI